MLRNTSYIQSAFFMAGIMCKLLWNKLRDKEGTGEFLSFAVIVTMLCVIMVIAIGFSQLSSNMNTLNNTLSVIARTAAVANSMDSARENAFLTAQSAIIEGGGLSNISVSVEYLNSTGNESWKAGTRLLVTLAADIQTVSPFTSGRQTRKAVVSVEKIMNGLLRGMLGGSVTKYGRIGFDYPMTSGFGPREAEIEGMSTVHMGIDFAMPVGTELVAPADCLVKYTGFDPARGYWIVMYVGEGYYVLYQHLSSISASTGQYLEKGATVAFSGNSGIGTGAHLHLEVLYSPDRKDSLTYFNGSENRVNPYSFIFG